MKKFYVLFFFGFLIVNAFSQQAEFSVVEYMPAPGQHINIENIGTLAAALKITDNFSSSVSLGSFGGYIVLKFDKPCVNHPGNPYGIDFNVFGNAFSGSSEPGVIWVMKDENRNGLPDDTWYEISGSHHFHPQTVKNYEVTYYKTASRDVLWKDNFGKTGVIAANSFNPQEYYPTTEYFPEYPSDSVTFSGTLLVPEIDFSDSQEIKIKPPAFGYADCRSVQMMSGLFVPDNPYTPGIEGAGGDPVDISWAVDSRGNYVVLDTIHFVKIVSGTLAGAGWLGEISTDVAWIELVRQDYSVSGKENMLVVYPYPERIPAGDSFQIEAVYFEKGRKKDVVLSFSTDNEQIAKVKENGIVTTENTGKAKIAVHAENETEVIGITVVKPESLKLLTNFSSVYPGDMIEIEAVVLDNESIEIDLPFQVISSDSGIAEVNESNGKYFLEAVRPGVVNLIFSAGRFDFHEEITVKILSPEDKIRIYFTAKTADENILPWQWIEADAVNLNGYVENPQSDYSGFNKPTLFHALAAGLKKAGVPFSFRDDDASNGKLYLYSVENDGLFSYGWGGKTTPAAFAKAWIVRHNEKQYLNEFQNISISDGDTVALYHVGDITKTWHYSRLLSDKDSVAENEEITLYLERLLCRYNNGIISESSFSPVANAGINPGNALFTDSEGKVSFNVEKQPPVNFYSGNDAVLISAKTAVGTQQLNKSGIRVFPNPFYDEISIMNNDNLMKPAGIRLLSPAGTVLFEKKLNVPEEKLNLSYLPAGVYFIVITQDEKTDVRKIIKR